MHRTLSVLFPLCVTLSGYACAGQVAPAPPAWHEVARLRAGQTAGPVTLAGMWAFVPNMGDGTVTQIDRQARRVVATIRVSEPKVLLDQGCAPTDTHAYFYGSWGLRECNTPFALGWDGASLWAIDNGLRQLVRIDPVARAAVDRIDLPGKAWDISIVGTTGWLSGYWDDALYKVDLAQNRVLAQIDGLDHGPAALVATADSVWVLCTRAGRLSRINVGDFRVAATYGVEPWSVDVVAEASAIFVRGTDGGDISRLSAADGAVEWTKPGPKAVGYYGVDRVGTAPNGLWLSGPTTARINPSTGEIAERISRPSMAASFGSNEIWLIGLDGSVSEYAQS